MIDPKNLIRDRPVSTFCRKSEEFFQRIKDNSELHGKPFANAQAAPRLILRLGFLLSGIRLGGGMTILDFGAGTCWLSKMLNQMQCATISVDPSITALTIGQRLFKEFPIVGEPILPPRFIVFEGHHISVEDNSIDRIVCFDAFHHVPNQKEILKEFHRVLKPGGIAGFSEPGPHHSKANDSQAEMMAYGVLENDILLEEIKALADEVGFSGFFVKPHFDCDPDLDYEDYRNIMSKREIPKRLQDNFIMSMENDNIFFLTKGKFMLDSRNRQGLKHSLHVKGDRLSGKVNEPLTLQAAIKNTGEAKWLVDNIKNIGVVFVGMHLYDSSDNLLDLDFYRKKISKELYPGDETSETLSIIFPNPGTYHLIVDLVSERVCWFEQNGSVPQRILVEVI
ncbi:MAG: class I SAM-dependent methyltransferase [Syntrophales bacterium]